MLAYVICVTGLAIVATLYELDRVDVPSSIVPAAAETDRIDRETARRAYADASRSSDTDDLAAAGEYLRYAATTRATETNREARRERVYVEDVGNGEGFPADALGGTPWTSIARGEGMVELRPAAPPDPVRAAANVAT